MPAQVDTRKHRDNPQDLSHSAHRLQTTLTYAHKQIVVHSPHKPVAAAGRLAGGNHTCDQLRTARGVKRRLTRPRTPQINGMVERFNGCTSGVLDTHCSYCAQDLQQTLLRHVALSNQ